MCDQTEINYLDGEVVWVKLGPCWWPGEVTGVDNLPEDLKVDFRKKPHIAAVKFFQENSYEFVKNLHQIYKYNCTQKDEFIKKGLDKHRAKRKDGSSVMDKFPGDVKIAEERTGGDPDILASKKFCEEEKPDISSLFGEKKLPKRKQRGKDGEMTRRSYGGDSSRRITHPRFLKESDHEVRIRQQPSSHPTTPTAVDGQQVYSCPLCNFTSTRVNVIICHNKSHRSGGVEPAVSRSSHSVQKSRSLGGGETPKRKYARKNKSLPKIKNDRDGESLKRKHQKQAEKVTKKKKSDPEIKELLADWDDGSDDDMDVDLNKSTDASSVGSPSAKDMKKNTTSESDNNDNSTDLLKGTETLLKETEKLSMRLENTSNNKTFDTDSETDVASKSSDFGEKSPLSKKIKKTVEEKKNSTADTDQDKKSRLSCFDFEEEELGPAIPPVRKIPRVFGEKNTSLKKELIKEFTMSQALANEKEAEEKEIVKKESKDLKHSKQFGDVIKDTDPVKPSNDEEPNNTIAESVVGAVSENDDQDAKLSQEILQTVNEASELVAKIASETERSNEGKSKRDATVTEFEIVEILQIDRGKEGEDEQADENAKDEAFDKKLEETLKNEVTDNHEAPARSPEATSSLSSPKKCETPSSPLKDSEKKMEDINSGRVTIETEEETLSIPQLAGSGGGGMVDMGWNQLNEIIGNSEEPNRPKDSPMARTPPVEDKPVTRRGRGRPRKRPLQTDVSGNGDSAVKPLSEDLSHLPGTPDSQDTDRKTSESEGERSYTGRRRKPNKKYLEPEIYSSSPGRRTPKTDDSQSETEERPIKEHKRGKRGRKPSAINKNIRKSLEEYEFSDQTLDSAEEIGAGASTPTPKSPTKSIPGSGTPKRSDVMSPIHITDLLATSDVEIRGIQPANSPDLKTSPVKGSESNEKLAFEDEDEKRIEMLPPKKSQIKKFELSQIDFFDSRSGKSEGGDEIQEKLEQKVETVTEIVKDSPSKIDESSETVAKIMANIVDMEDNSTTIVEETIENIVIEETIVQEKDEPTESLLGNEEHVEKITEVIEQTQVISESSVSSVVPQETVQSAPTASEISSLEAVLSDKPVQIPQSQESPISSPATPQNIISDLTNAGPSPEESIATSFSVVQQQQKQQAQQQTPAVPVKKREKPRIIENVALKEPMQILKSKLLEKQPVKSVKHKLETEVGRKDAGVCSPRTKIMKIDTPPNSKSKSPVKTNTTPLSITKKLQVLKAEEALELQNEKANVANTISIPTAGTQVQNLSEMELDINSIPFVMSEDLNPDSIEQMPVMMSSIISSSGTTLTLTSPVTTTATQQIEPTNQVQLKQTVTPAEGNSAEGTPAKKKTTSPAILAKPKAKAKPTITSIKTLVPPLTGGVKGIKFQNTQTATKATPVLTNQQKITSGKYVVVRQTAGGQPCYTKMPISTAGKVTGSPQIIQQGGKVVILTSATGQSKVVPFGVQKTSHGGKVQKIISNKGQIVSQISPKATIIAPKSDTSSPTTSKLSSGPQKLLNPGVISPKGVFTSISGTKTILTSIPQQLFTKGGVITGITPTSISGKTIISQKAIVTNKGTLYAPISSQVGTKTILAPISQASLVGKTIAQGLVPAKGTVLTPFTGQQVKAMQAKTPVKGGKLQGTYPAIQQKLQIPMLQKKVPISPGSTVKAAGTLKSSTGTLIFQNTAQLQQQTQTPVKAAAAGKKVVRQTSLMFASSPTIKSPQVQTQQVLQRSKSLTAPLTPQKIASPQKIRQTKQKIVVQKVIQEGASSPKSLPAGVMTSIIKTPQGHQKTAVSTATGTGKIIKGVAPVHSRAIQKQPLTSVNQTAATMMTSMATATTTGAIHSATGVISSESGHVETEKKLESEEALLKTAGEVAVPGKLEAPLTDPVKSDEHKTTPAQPQIMAIPTESPDGTTAYVLVTIDEQGQIQPLDNNAYMSIEGSTSSADGSKTIYIDPSCLDPSGTLDNIVLQFDNSVVPTLPASNAVSETNQTVSEGFQTSNQDILAAALANTDFQQEIGLPEAATSSVMSTGLTQTSLDTQTILQSTLIPSTEPISSPAVLETSLTLNQPIMTPLEVPSSVAIQPESETNTVPVSSIPSSLELPITIATNSTISYISTTEGSIQIPGNSMPDIGEIMETSEPVETAQTEPVTTQYLVIPNLEENIIQTQPQGQPQQQSELQPQGELSSSSESTAAVSYAVSIPENVVLEASEQIQTTPSMPIIDDSYTENVQFSTNVPTSESTDNFSSACEAPPPEKVQSGEEDAKLQTSNQEQPEQPVTTQEITRDMPIVGEEEDVHNLENQTNDVTDSNVITSCIPAEDQPCVSSASNTAVVESSASTFETPESESTEAEPISKQQEVESISDSKDESTVEPEPMETEDSVDHRVHHMETAESEVKQSAESSTQPIVEPMEINFEDGDQGTSEISQEAPSQSYEKFDNLSMGNDETISQSTSKSDNSGEATQSLTYEPMELDETPIRGEPPTQSFEDAKSGESAVVSASESYDTLVENTNAPTQSFSEITQERADTDDVGDDPSFPTQSYEVGKADNLPNTLETDGEISQEGNIPSQSNDVGNDGIGTSTFSNNSGLNEDETASSSYVPETPETQERDQDQESAISTSSYEIPPCEEINIASSSVIPDTSVGSEHASIHDNGIPEIPTSSYNLNPDSSSTHVDAVPTSSYEDQIIVEQNVSTSYEVPISMPGLDENSSQNFVSESGDQQNEPSSYYTRNPEEVTSEPSQSYFVPEGPSPSYGSQTVSPSYYDVPPETEASQSYYSTQEIDRTDQSRNVEASPSFYQETTDGIRLRQQGEATPTYTERYPVDYTLENSPIERHDLVESSVPATKPTER